MHYDLMHALCIDAKISFENCCEGTIGIVSEYKNDAWRQVGILKQPRYGHSAIIFNNLIYIIGGKGNVFGCVQISIGKCR